MVGAMRTTLFRTDRRRARVRFEDGELLIAFRGRRPHEMPLSLNGKGLTRRGKSLTRGTTTMGYAGTPAEPESGGPQHE
jgi:hypothetical protein